MSPAGSSLIQLACFDLVAYITCLEPIYKPRALPRRRGRQSFGPFPPLFLRVLSTPRDRPTNIRAREPSSRLSVRGFVRFFLFSFFSLIIQRAPRLARVAFLRAVARAPSRNPCAFSFGNVASSHTHTLSLSLSEPRHTPSNSPVERPLRDHLPYTSHGVQCRLCPIWVACLSCKV